MFRYLYFRFTSWPTFSDKHPACGRSPVSRSRGRKFYKRPCSFRHATSSNLSRSSSGVRRSPGGPSGVSFQWRSGLDPSFSRPRAAGPPYARRDDIAVRTASSIPRLARDSGHFWDRSSFLFSPRKRRGRHLPATPETL